MTLEAGLRSHLRDGYRLLGTAEVAIPVSLLGVRVLVEGFTEIPDSTRYLLELIVQGITSQDELGSLLGLSPQILEVVLQSAILDRYVAVHVDDSVEATQSGLQALSETRQLTVSHKTIPIGIDRMTNDAFPWLSIPRHLKLRPRQLENWNAENPEDVIHKIPHPRRNPRLEDLQGDSRAISAIGEILDKEQVPPRLVDVVSIEGNVKRLFRIDAVGLRIAPLGGGDPEWDFLVGGVRSEKHAQAFLRFEKNNKRTLIPEPPPHPLDHVTFGLTPEEIRNIDEVDWTETARRSELRERKETLAERAETAPAEIDVSKLISAIEETSEDLDSGPTVLAESGLPRVLHVHDHRSFMLQHVAAARERVLIVSPWITPDAYDEDVEHAIRTALENGAHVGIRYGYAGKGISGEIASRLNALAVQYPRFDHLDLGNSHVKLLAVDDRFLAIGSFNWLSFRGSKERTFREEKTYVLEDRDIMDREFHEYFSQAVYEESLPSRDDTAPTAQAVLFVEGWTDMRFLELTTEVAARPDLLDGIEIRHTGGARKVVSAAIAFAQNFPETPMLALFDSDEIGRACAKDVRNYVNRSNKVVHLYGEVFGRHRVGTEAENLFPPALVERFVEENSEHTVFDSMSIEPETGDRIYQINKDYKELVVEWLAENLEPADTDLWIAVIEQVRSKMGLD